MTEPSATLPAVNTPNVKPLAKHGRLRAGAGLALAVLAFGLSTEPPLAAKDEVPSKSAPLAASLSKDLEARKLQYIAAPDPSEPGRYVAAMHMAGVQISVISAKYSAPELIREKLITNKYQDIYVDLSSASERASRIIIDDLKGDGIIRSKPKNPPFDFYESAGKKVVFDFDWRKQKLTQEEYGKALEAADELYARLLGLLAEEAKKAK
jgi:hypothetical protein